MRIRETRYNSDAMDSFTLKAEEKDKEFPCYEDEFEVPTFRSLGIATKEFPDDKKSVYFCGNSLGLMPKAIRTAINQELNAWSQRGVESHFNHPGENETDKLTSWVDIDLPLVPLMAPIVGAKDNEVAVMGSLTSNLNSLLISFYKPRGKKTKILFEKQAFPSDYYAFVNLVKLFGYDESHLIQLESDAHNVLQTEYILEQIEKYKDEIAIVCFPGIQYYTGQFFDIEKITKFAKERDIIVGWDLAHAVGNVSLKLHEWQVDFAAWCSYKYLNSGPGAIAGIFVNEQYTKDNSPKNYPPRLAGWWANNPKERFKMLEKFDPMNSALSYRQSNPSVIDVVSLHTSLKMFQQKGGMEALSKKSLELTNFQLELLSCSKYLINSENDVSSGFKIITPTNPKERGAQLSLLFQPDDLMEKVMSYLHDYAIICDERRPNVIRLAPVPLYNTFKQVVLVVQKLEEALKIHLEN